MMKGGMAGAAGVFWFNLETKCVNGKKGTATVVLTGPDLGFGARFSGSGGKVELKEPLNIVDPSIFKGDGFVATAGLAIPGPIGTDVGPIIVGGKLPNNGGSCSAVRLGVAGGYGCGLIRGRPVNWCYLWLIDRNV